MRKRVYVLLSVITILVIAICIYNIACSGSKFWEINVFNGLTLLWTIVFSFIITQASSRYQRRAEIIIKLLSRLNECIDESRTCNISVDADKNVILMRKREIANLISLLDRNADRFGIRKEVNFIKTKFKEYEQFISDHINDIEYLSKSSSELQRPIKLISTKIIDTMLKL